MEFEMTKPVPAKLEDAVLVTHQGCMDGAGCAIMFMGAGGRRENIKFVAAGMVERFVKEDPVFETDRFLIFADVGLNTPRYADVLERRGNLVMLDHHNTSLHLAGRHWAEIEERNERCGTRMMRDWLLSNFPEESKRLQSTSWRHFADTIDDHDRWLRKIPSSEELATFMVFVGQQDFITRFQDPKERVCRSTSEGRGKDLFSQFERDLLGILDRRRDEAIEEMVRKAKVRELVLPDGSRVTAGVIVSNEPNISLMLQRLLDKRPDIDVAVQVTMDKGSASLRSRDGSPDVSKIAGFFGGGGHKAAAGHRLPQDLTDVILEHIYNG